MHISRYADKLGCPHCGGINSSKDWPVNGDFEGIYCQEEPGNFSIKMLCPHCGKEWYVVWDDNPGPIRPLDRVGAFK